MRRDIPTLDLDQRSHVSVHAPAQNMQLQDHVSVHAPAHNFKDHVSVHASPVRSVVISSTAQTALQGGSSASAVMLPKLRIPVEEAVASVAYPDADISIKIKGEITLNNKGSLADLKLGISRKRAGVPFEIKSSTYSFFNAEGEFTGTDEASMRISPRTSRRSLI